MSVFFLAVTGNVCRAQPDTLRVMAYNVLYYGDRPSCQGAHSIYHDYLKNIIGYAHPDIVGLEKMAAIPVFAGDHSGTAPEGFADSILDFAFNAAYPARYAYCTFTNNAGADNISMLFYNVQKLGFAGIVSSYVNITDFNTYRLYYKSADLAVTHDTIFLFVTLNHAESGGSTGDINARAAQIAGEMGQIKTHFSSLPNMINMGDFNTHSSSEPCYQALIAPADTAFLFFDPPFYPDAVVSYPAYWDTHPSSFAPFLTTSTRQSGSVPNACGTSGGGKSWYDHILLSSSIVYNTAGIYYVPHSYTTLGNDGNRTGISVNDPPLNISAPATVIGSLFQMSNKYPVMADLAVTQLPSRIKETVSGSGNVRIINPVKDKLVIYFPERKAGTCVRISCMDMTGVVQFDRSVPYDHMQEVSCTMHAGLYLLRISEANDIIYQTIIVKE